MHLFVAMFNKRCFQAYWLHHFNRWLSTVLIYPIPYMIVSLFRSIFGFDSSTRLSAAACTAWLIFWLIGYRTFSTCDFFFLVNTWDKNIINFALIRYICSICLLYGIDLLRYFIKLTSLFKGSKIAKYCSSVSSFR